MAEAGLLAHAHGDGVDRFRDRFAHGDDAEIFIGVVLWRPGSADDGQGERRVFHLSVGADAGFEAGQIDE